MSADDSERELTLTADSIDKVTDTLTAVEALAGRDVDPADVRVALPLTDEEIERVETHIRADRYTVGAGGDSQPASPVEAAADKDGYERGPNNHDPPSNGEVQPSPVAFDPPKNGTIQYAALALVCYETTADGDNWVTTDDLVALDVCPYEDKQISSALSHLWRNRGCLVRRGADDGYAHSVEYRPIPSSRDHARATGAFPWPADAGDPPAECIDSGPFFVED